MKARAEPSCTVKRDSPVGRRMPVLVHITTVSETLGFLTEQVGGMKARGFEVHVVSAPGPLLNDFARSGSVEAHAVPMTRKVTPLGDLVSVFRLWRVLRRLRPQIVHAYTPKGGLLGMIAAWAAGVPVRFYSVLGLPLVTASGLRKVLLRGSERVSCRLAHRVLGISRSVREEVIGQNFCPPGKIAVLLEGGSFGIDAIGRFNPARFGPAVRRAERARLGIPEAAPVVGFVGRLVCDKGVPELMAAWGLLREEFPDLYLIIAGPFEEHAPLPAVVVEQMRSDDRVRLTGHVGEPASLYAAMDLLTLPTHREGFGQVLLEAAAMGLPVVATRVTGCVDSVQDGTTGTLVPPRNAHALAAAVALYLRNPGLRIAHGSAGRARVLRCFRSALLEEATFQEYVSMLRPRGLPLPAPGCSPPVPGRAPS